ncbi:MAG: ABC transporter ATP-binding protein [Candidatus Altarchaeaceae archaeon]
MISVKNLQLKYGKNEILNDVTFDVEKGKVIGIVGPNGAGKSTLLKVITGIIKQNGGEVIVDGKNIKNLKRKEIARIMGVVPQRTPINPLFTCFDYVIMGRYAHIEKRAQVFESENDLNIAREAMRMCGAEEFMERKLDEVSGGQLQLVIIARALAQQPKILLLDEPTTGLDLKHSMRIMNLVRNLVKNNGITAVVVVHELNLAARFCDEVLILHNKKIVAYGKPRDVLTEENIRNVYGVNVKIIDIPETNSFEIVVIDEAETDGKFEKTENIKET